MRDLSRLFWLKQRLIWVPYERYEYTRLQNVRREMDLHKTYRKEDVIGGKMQSKGESTNPDNNMDEEEAASTQDQEKFIWAYVIRPVHQSSKKV